MILTIDTVLKNNSACSCSIKGRTCQDWGCVDIQLSMNDSRRDTTCW